MHYIRSLRLNGSLYFRYPLIWFIMPNTSSSFILPTHTFFCLEDIFFHKIFRLSFFAKDFYFFLCKIVMRIIFYCLRLESWPALYKPILARDSREEEFPTNANITAHFWFSSTNHVVIIVTAFPRVISIKFKINSYHFYDYYRIKNQNESYLHIHFQ